MDVRELITALGRWDRPLRPEIRDGRITLPLFRDGHPDRRLLEQLQQNLNIPRDEAVAAFGRIQTYLDENNAQVEAIRRNTQVTNRPHIVMASPEDWGQAGAVVSWMFLKARLEASGAQVELPAAFGRLDNGFEVWTRDRYVLRADGAAIFPRELATNENFATVPPALRLLYRDNGRALERDLQARGIRTERIDGYFEGGNVLQHRQSNTVFVGVAAPGNGDRGTSIEDAQKLADALGMRLVPVSIRSGDFYHLDTLMSVLPDGSVIVRPDGTDAASMERIRAVVPSDQRLELATPEFVERDVRVATNLVTVNGNVFTPYAPPEMTAFLERRGFRVQVGDYALSDSGPHCQVNVLDGGRTPDGRSDVASVEIPRVPDQRGNSRRV